MRSSFLSGNQQLLEKGQVILGNMIKNSFRKVNKFGEIWNLVYFNIELVQNFAHINFFLQLWAQVIQSN